MSNERNKTVLLPPLVPIDKQERYLEDLLCFVLSSNDLLATSYSSEVWSTAIAHLAHCEHQDGDCRQTVDQRPIYCRHQHHPFIISRWNYDHRHVTPLADTVISSKNDDKLVVRALRKSFASRL